ncbi:MAG: TetR/AcrR family transcriptional regulator [Deltaproteobacteria bacterium]|nr:TetR/AcrR family transcriptional regulator [Deltaproteobacteria bacterium]
MKSRISKRVTPRRPPARRPGAQARGRTPLTRARIVRKALQLIESEGLGQFSMRKLGGALKVNPMSLYHHFASHDALVDAMLDEVAQGITLPPIELHWKARLRLLAVEYRGIARRHPHLWPLLVLHRWNTAPALEVLEAITRCLRDGGLEVRGALKVFRSLGYFLNGVGLEENVPLRSAVVPVPQDEQARRFPITLSFWPAMLEPGSRDAAFDWGLDVLLDAMDRLPRVPARR